MSRERPTPPPPKQVPPVERAFAAAVALAAGATLALAASLSPDSAGHGTHTQIGLPSCGWLARYGRPCPTCGMTTSFAHAADADLPAAFVTQPGGALLAVTTSAVFWGALYVAASGSTLGRSLTRAAGMRTIWIALGIGAAAWAYKLSATPVV